MTLCDACKKQQAEEICGWFLAAKAPPELTILGRSVDDWIAEIGDDAETMSGFARYIAATAWEWLGVRRKERPSVTEPRA
jgi:hypothetical protein